MKKWIDLIAQWAAVISGSFVFIGILRALLYYLPFHIPIHTYIDLSEVFTIWFPDTLFSVFGICIMAGVFLFTKYVPRESRLEFYYYHSMVYVFHAVALLYLYTDLLGNFYGNHSSEKHEFLLPFWLLISLLSIMALPMLFGGAWRLYRSAVGKASDFQKSLLKTDVRINLGFLTFYLFWYFIYAPLGTQISSSNAGVSVELIGEKKVIRTDNSLRYIGKTRNYIFLWDKKSQTATIYTADQFPEIRVVSKQ